MISCSVTLRRILLIMMHLWKYSLILSKVVYLSYFFFLMLLLPFIVTILIFSSFILLFILSYFILPSYLLYFLILSYFLLYYPILSFRLNRFGAPPEWVIFNEVVHSKQTMIREISKIDPKWLLEIAGHYFTIKWSNLYHFLKTSQSFFVKMFLASSTPITIHKWKKRYQLLYSTCKVSLFYTMTFYIANQIDFKIVWNLSWNLTIKRRIFGKNEFKLSV